MMLAKFARKAERGAGVSVETKHGHVYIRKRKQHRVAATGKLAGVAAIGARAVSPPRPSRRAQRGRPSAPRPLGPGTRRARPASGAALARRASRPVFRKLPTKFCLTGVSHVSCSRRRGFNLPLRLPGCALAMGSCHVWQCSPEIPIQDRRDQDPIKFHGNVLLFPEKFSGTVFCFSRWTEGPRA